MDWKEFIEIKENYTNYNKLKLNNFLVKAVKFIRDYSLDHLDTFNLPREIPIKIWRKALFLLNDRVRGPFYEVKENCGAFIKKKRKIEQFETRKK